MRKFHLGGSRAFIAALLGAVLVSAGCGSTRNDKELAEAYGQISASAAPDAAAAQEAPADAGADPGAVASSEAAPGEASSFAPGSNSATAAGRTGSAATPGVSGSAGVAAGGSKAAAGGSKAASGGAKGAPAAPGTPAPAGGTKAPIVLGSIGSDSGVLGQILLPVLSGAKAWAADVNARGGLNGHPVKVIFADDGGDPGRALSLAQRMVDQEGAVAFYAERGPGTAQAVNTFLEQRGIPVIGGCGCSVSAAKSPMSFMVGAGGDVGLAWMHTLPLLTLSDKRKASLVYCRESPSCKSGRDHVVNTFAKQTGLQIVHEAQVSITAPDYTAEVLAAKNAGAEGFIAFMDNFSVTRLAKSAHRQNWNPLFSVQFSFHDERATKAGGADVDGFLVGAAMPHWTSPKLNEFRAAMQRYVPGGVLGSWSEMAWGAGKLLEVIAKGFGDKVTSADFLNGLYALNGETLGGLVPPLAYQKGQGSDLSNLCIVAMKVEGGKFVPAKGDNFTCAPGWQPVRK
jgi:branched-chain amino acid transport system substrate-binding protein